MHGVLRIYAKKGEHPQYRWLLLFTFTSIVNVGQGPRYRRIELLYLCSPHSNASPLQAAQTPCWGGSSVRIDCHSSSQQNGCRHSNGRGRYGQLICAVLLDHFGWLSFDVHPASWPRYFWLRLNSRWPDAGCEVLSSLALPLLITDCPGSVSETSRIAADPSPPGAIPLASFLQEVASLQIVYTAGSHKRSLVLLQ